MQISPGVPNGTSTSSSSNINTSVLGTGMPMDPVNSFTNGVFTQTTGEVSDSPYPWAIGTPIIFCQSSAVFLWTAIPPPIVAKRWGNLTWLNSGRCINAWNKVLTPGKILISGCFINNFIKPVISRGLATNNNLAPLRIPSRPQAVSAKIWVMGKAHKKTNCCWRFFKAGSSQDSIWMILAKILRCNKTAPLDTPVVPPVYCKKAMSSSLRLGLVKPWPEPILRAWFNLTQGKFQCGISFLIWRAIKLMITPFGPRLSPMLLTITFFTSPWLAISWYTWAKFSSITKTDAPLSWSWCSSSRAV